MRDRNSNSNFKQIFLVGTFTICVHIVHCMLDARFTQKKNMPDASIKLKVQCGVKRFWIAHTTFTGLNLTWVCNSGWTHEANLESDLGQLVRSIIHEDPSCRQLTLRLFGSVTPVTFSALTNAFKMIVRLLVATNKDLIYSPYTVCQQANKQDSHHQWPGRPHIVRTEESFIYSVIFHIIKYHSMIRFFFLF